MNEHEFENPPQVPWASLLIGAAIGAGALYTVSRARAKEPPKLPAAPGVPGVEPVPGVPAAIPRTKFYTIHTFSHIAASPPAPEIRLTFGTPSLTATPLGYWISPGNGSLLSVVALLDIVSPVDLTVDLVINPIGPTPIVVSSETLEVISGVPAVFNMPRSAGMVLGADFQAGQDLGITIRGLETLAPNIFATFTATWLIQ